MPVCEGECRYMGRGGSPEGCGKRSAELVGIVSGLLESLEVRVSQLLDSCPTVGVKSQQAQVTRSIFSPSTNR